MITIKKCDVTLCNNTVTDMGSLCPSCKEKYESEEYTIEACKTCGCINNITRKGKRGKVVYVEFCQICIK